MFPFEFIGGALVGSAVTMVIWIASQRHEIAKLEKAFAELAASLTNER